MATLFPISTPQPFFTTRSNSQHPQNLIKPSHLPIFCSSSSSSSLQTPQSTVVEETSPPFDDMTVDSAIGSAEKVQISKTRQSPRKFRR